MSIPWSEDSLVEPVLEHYQFLERAIQETAGVEESNKHDAFPDALPDFQDWPYGHEEG